MNLFVGNLSPETTGNSLRTLFSEFGEVVASKVIFDNATGMSRGFGFVEMADKFQAQNAVDNLDVAFFEGNIISVKEARQNTTGGGGGGSRDRNSGGGNRSFNKPRTPRPGGYNSGSGGYNSGSGGYNSGSGRSYNQNGSGNYSSNNQNSGSGGYNNNNNNSNQGGGGFNNERY